MSSTRPRRVAALAAVLFLSGSTARAAGLLQDEGTPQNTEQQEPQLEIPGNVEDALAISSGDLEKAFEGKSAEELAQILTSWMALIQHQQGAHEEAITKIGETGDQSEASQIATDRDVLIGQAEMILGAVAELGGSDEEARAIIRDIRTSAVEEESVSTVPVNQETALELDTEVLKAQLRPLTLEQATGQMALWLQFLQQKCIAVKNAEVSALLAEDAAKIEQYNAQAVDARAGRSRLIDRVNIVIRSVEAKSGDVTEARAFVSSVVVTPPITGARAAWTTAIAWMTNPDGGLALARSVGMALGVVIASWILAKFLGRVAARAMRKVPRTSELLKSFVATSVQRLVILLGVLMALGQLGVSMGPWIAAIGAAGLVVGLALQGTLSNFASGIMIMIYRPFDVGDVIATAGPTGKVEGMTLVTTTIKTFDNQTVHIPNNMVWGDVITNITANDTRRVDMVFGIGYGDDVRKAKEVLLDVTTSHEKVLADPEPNVQLHELADSSVNFIVRPWVNTDDYWDVYWDVTQAVKERFDRDGISIPFPQRDVHLIPVDANGDAKEWVQPPAASGSKTHEAGPAEQQESESATN